MKELKVKILKEYRGHINPDREYHLVDIETGRELVGNLKKEDIEYYINVFNLTLVEE